MNTESFNRAVRDPELSWNATGVLCYLVKVLADPNPGAVAEAMEKGKADTDENFRNGLTELMEQGYVWQKADGSWGVSLEKGTANRTF